MSIAIAVLTFIGYGMPPWLVACPHSAKHCPVEITPPVAY